MLKLDPRLGYDIASGQSKAAAWPEHTRTIKVKVSEPRSDKVIWPIAAPDFKGQWAFG